MVDEPRIRVDEDWKAQAEEEKRRLEESIEAKKKAEEKTAGAGSGAGTGDEPAEQGSHSGNRRVSLLVLVEQLAAQAMTCLGQMPDPRTGQTFLELELARDTIDLIGVLEEKTRGNLTDEEERVMNDVLHSLRVGYTTVSRAAAERATQAPPGDPAAGAGGPPPEGGKASP